MRITFDEAKRARTLAEQGLDFAEAEAIFSGPTVDLEDERRDYGEHRMVTVGLLRGRMVVLVWTGDTGARRIIAMRKANEREQRTYRERLG